MPELPEVETVRRTLAAALVGARIRAVDVRFPGCLQPMDPEAFSQRIVNRRMSRWGRKGKYLVVGLDDGSCLSIHLRMTGRLWLGAEGRDAGPHTRLVFHLGEHGVLYFDDQRKFGRVGWFPDEAGFLAQLRLGPEPIDPSFTPGDLLALVRGRTRPIKSLLLDQTVLAGVGNIYADEALYRARIRPVRPAGALEEDEVGRLWTALRAVLHEAIEHHGTTFRDYVDGAGRQGTYQQKLQVYGREGKPCYTCAAMLVREKVGGRSSVYCPSCQR